MISFWRKFSFSGTATQLEPENHLSFEISKEFALDIVTPWPFRLKRYFHACIWPSWLRIVGKLACLHDNSLPILTEITQINTKHVSCDTVSWYWKWGSLTLIIKIIWPYRLRIPGNSTKCLVYWSRPAKRYYTSQHVLVFSCDQGSVRLSICLSCHTFFTIFPSLYHHEIYRSYYHWQKWCPCKRARSQVKTQFSCFRTVTPIWIHIWRWNDALSLMWHRRGALMFFKVICQISMSHGTKNCRFSLNVVVCRL